MPALCNIHDVQLAKEFCNRIIGLQDGYKKFDGATETMRDADLDVIYEMEVLLIMASIDVSPAALDLQGELRRKRFLKMGLIWAIVLIFIGWCVQGHHH